MYHSAIWQLEYWYTDFFNHILQNYSRVKCKSRRKKWITGKQITKAAVMHVVRSTWVHSIAQTILLWFVLNWKMLNQHWIERNVRMIFSLPLSLSPNIKERLVEVSVCVHFQYTNKHLLAGGIRRNCGGDYWLLHNRIELQCSTEFIWHHL